VLSADPPGSDGWRRLLEEGSALGDALAAPPIRTIPAPTAEKRSADFSSRRLEILFSSSGAKARIHLL